MVNHMMELYKLNENTSPGPGANDFNKKQLRKKQLEQRMMNPLYSDLKKMFSVLPLTTK